jgi:hypothetical protein
VGERGRVNICYTLISEKDLELYREEFDLVLIDLVKQGFYNKEFL